MSHVQFSSVQDDFSSRVNAKEHNEMSPILSFGWFGGGQRKRKGTGASRDL